MPKQNILRYIKELGRSVFTTNELITLSGKSSSVVTQSLNYLQKHTLITKVYRGIWIQTGTRVSPYSLIPFLTFRCRMYVSFISALHLHGMIEQIPQVITVASTTHTRKVFTRLGTFSIHQVSPRFFKGFDWYRGKGNFLIAEPEKALVDSLYLSAHKKKQFGFFPEMNFPKEFRFSKTRNWAREIPQAKIRCCVQKKLAVLLKRRKA